MILLVEIVTSIVKMLIELWIKQAKEPSHDTAIDVDRDPALRARLEQLVLARKRADDLGSIGRTGPIG